MPVFCIGLLSLALSPAVVRRHRSQRRYGRAATSRAWRMLRRSAATAKQAWQDADLVRYMPPLDFEAAAEENPDGAYVLPCFPLGSMAYIPFDEQILQIFEPRYRQMYNDILLSGGRRFVVPHVKDPGDANEIRFGEVGVVFYLKDLKEVSEETQDQIKYRCTHELIGRVRLKRVLNPRQLADKTSYLRVEVEDVVDTDAEVDCSDAEDLLLLQLERVASMQESTAGNPTDGNTNLCFDKQRLGELNRTVDDWRKKLWQVTRMWQDTITGRVEVRQQQFMTDIQEIIKSYYAREQMDPPARVVLSELPPSVQNEVLELQKGCEEELTQLVAAQTTLIKLLVQSDSHSERLSLFKAMLEEETKRLEARQALKDLFSDKGTEDNP